MNMQELLRLQAEYSKDNNRLAKQDRIIQLAQVYEEQKIKKDEDLNVKTLKGLEKSLRDSLEVQKGLRKDVQELSKTLKEDTAGKDVQESEKNKETTKELASNLKSLKDVIKENIKSFVKNGGGEKTGKEIVAAQKENTGSGSKLRKVLLGSQTSEQVNKGTWTGMSSSIDKYLSRRAEKQDFIKNARINDAGTIGVQNLQGKKNIFQRIKGNYKANQYAGKKFEAIKDKEQEIADVQNRISTAQAAGYQGKVKDKDQEKALTKELIEIDPRRKAQFKADAKEQLKVQTAQSTDKKGKEVKLEKSEDQAESDTAQATFSADTLKAQHEIGSSLIQSLDIQKQQLAALTKIAEGGMGGSGEEGGGSSALSTAADLASSVGKGGKGKMLGKAAGFLGRHAGKIGAIGGVAMGAYDAYEGWSDASEAEKRGEITHEQANVKKGGAVGKGVGGAGGALAGAAAGAAIGSVVPVVGTAIGGLVGGAIGYWGGSKAGEAVGTAGTKAYQGMKPGEHPTNVDAMGNVIGVSNDTSRINDASANNAKLATSGAGGGNTLINTNTNNVINNTTTPNTARSPIRNQESTMSRYIDSRYR